MQVKQKQGGMGRQRVDMQRRFQDEVRKVRKQLDEESSGYLRTLFVEIQQCVQAVAVRNGFAIVRDDLRVRGRSHCRRGNVRKMLAQTSAGGMCVPLLLITRRVSGAQPKTRVRSRAALESVTVHADMKRKTPGSRGARLSNRSAYSCMTRSLMSVTCASAGTASAWRGGSMQEILGATSSSL